MGAENLDGRIKLLNDNLAFFKERLDTPLKNRGGFGLSRGFGEFLRALPQEDEWWADEIMKEVHSIETYFREM